MDPSPSAAISMLAALNCRGSTHLVIGNNSLASTRCAQSLSAGAHPVLVAAAGAELPHGLQKKVDDGLVRWERKAFEDGDLMRLGRDEVGNVVDAVFVTSGSRDAASSHIAQLCKRNRIPVNVVDAPDLCTFSLLSTHSDGPLQIGVTTNGRGCKLASRIRREVAASLPPDLGAACVRLGDLRRRIQEQDRDQGEDKDKDRDHDNGDGNDHEHDPIGDLDDSLDQAAHFNRLVAEGDAKNRRTRWLSQVCEYWPLRRLAAVSDEEIDLLFKAYPGSDPARAPAQATGRIILAGSGPGHPDLLTRATHKAIQAADLVLADKLVPAAVLELVPRRTTLRIARKFPGNADAAQDELQAAALAGVRAGLVVLRLKQGDPFVYGRGGEEWAFFAAAGLAARVVVLPGITSALSAPLFARVPATQRDVADQVLVCTGTGKKGRPPAPPEHVPTRTVVFLMALHRIGGLVRELTTRVELEPGASPDAPDGTAAGREPQAPSPPQAGDAALRRTLWPLETPCAVVERASCPDQRVIRTTLEFVARAVEAEGSRPPGLLVAGAACEALYKPESGRSWVVEEGFRGLDGLGAEVFEGLELSGGA